LNSALNYGGVTLSNSVTGTGNMVLSASPTLTGTLTAAAANFSGLVTPAAAIKLTANTFVTPSSGEGTINAAGNTGLYMAGFGSTYDLTLANRAGSGVGYIFANTTNFGFAGNVGIGMTPARTLDVTGTFGVTGASTLGGTLTAAAANWSGIQTINATTSGATSAMTIKGTTYSLLSIQKGADAQSAGFQLMNAANTQQWFVGMSESTNDYVWYNAPASAERVRITAAGSLLVGTTSSWTGCAAEFRAAGNALSSYNTTTSGTAFVSRVDNTGAKLATWNYNGSDVGTITTDGTNIAYNAVGALIFGTNGTTEVARFSTSGNLLVGATTAASTTRIYAYSTADSSMFSGNATFASQTNDVCLMRSARNTTNGSYNYFTAYNDGAGGYRFKVLDSGNVQNVNNSYGALSDLKVKQDIVLAASQWDDIKAIGQIVRKYHLKSDPEGPLQIGLVAQELQLISPGLVFSTPDRTPDEGDLGTETLGVNYSVLYMKAVKALGEALERIETLETRLAALENKS
jgi:hypothetical protein